MSDAQSKAKLLAITYIRQGRSKDAVARLLRAAGVAEVEIDFEVRQASRRAAPHSDEYLRHMAGLQQAALDSWNGRVSGNPWGWYYKGPARLFEQGV